MYPTQVQLPGNITEAGKKASQAAYEANNAAAATPSVIDALKQKITEAYSSNQDIVKNLDTSAANYYAAPSTARNAYQNIFNPFQREQLVSTATNQALAPYLSNSALYGTRLGRISDLIGAGTNAYSADVARQQGAAGLAQSNYQNLLNEYQVQQAVQNQLANQQLQQEQLALEKWKATHPTGSGGADPTIVAMLKRLLEDRSGGGGGVQITEAKPSTKPNLSGGFNNVSPSAMSSFTLEPFRSPDKQWVWNPSINDWSPAGNF